MSRSKQLEKAIADYLELMGYDFKRVDNYICPKCRMIFNKRAKGFPDFMAYNDKRLLFVEAKTGTGRLTKEQKLFKIAMEAQGIPYIVCRDSIDNLMYFFDK